MSIEIIRAQLPRDLAVLHELDNRIFRAADLFHESTWSFFDNYLLCVNGIPSGSTSLLPHHRDDSDAREIFPGERGTLYIGSTGILPHFRGSGMGLLFKVFQMAYAKNGGFRKVITCARASNVLIIHLNKKFGFYPVRSVPAYYKDPEEDRLVLQYTAP